MCCDWQFAQQVDQCPARVSSPTDGSFKARMLGFMENTVAMVMHFFLSAFRKEKFGVQLNPTSVTSIQLVGFKKMYPVVFGGYRRINGRNNLCQEEISVAL